MTALKHILSLQEDELMQKLAKQGCFQVFLHHLYSKQYLFKTS